MLLFLLACTPVEAETSEAPSRRLRAEGTRIVDGSGNEVPLRGVAVGGWNFH